MKKLRLFIKLDRKKKKLLLEAYLYLAWARILKECSFKRIAPSLGEQMKETTFAVRRNERKTLAQISEAIHLMSRYTFWESACLVKAIAALKMLEKRKIECTLYLGTAKDENGKLIAHAWVRSGPYYITGQEGKDAFTVVNSFAKLIQ